jgi:hypothetical protein
MPRNRTPVTPAKRRISHAAIVCFSVSSIAFVACGMGLIVNHAFTGTLAISGTAAVGLVYLAMGLMNLGYDPDDEVTEVIAVADVSDRGPEVAAVRPLPATEPPTFAPRERESISSTRDMALSARE